MNAARYPIQFQVTLISTWGRTLQGVQPCVQCNRKTDNVLERGEASDVSKAELVNVVQFVETKENM